MKRWQRRLSWIAGGLAVFLLLLWGVMYALMWHWIAMPPALDGAPSILALQPVQKNGRVYLGSNWFGRRDGLATLYLTGTPFEMGYANGVLTEKEIHAQEDSIVVLLNKVAPYSSVQFLLKFLVTYKNRRMATNIIPSLQMEMSGIARGCPDTHPFLGPYYNRILNYHGAQDISYMLMNSPLIRGACTAFGAWGAATTGDHLLCGRNFDWEADPVFDEDRIVTICEPRDGIPFISLAWAGMAGCVSGMNREGISITVNGAPSNLPADAATPTCLVAREVLQFAHTLQEATDIIRRRRVFVSAMFLIGSRADGKFIVVEKTPEKMAVREPEAAADSLVCANHYLTAEFKDDPINEVYKTADTSVARFDRLTELLQAKTNRLDAAECAAMLRDRALTHGHFAGNGHRDSLNPLIATHAVIMDLTAGIFWAGTAPHQLGKFVAFDLRDPEKLLPQLTLPADPILTNGVYARYLDSREALSRGHTDLRQKHFPDAEKEAALAETDNPGFYQNAWLLGDALRDEGKLAEAAQAYQRAIEGTPALGAERKRLEEDLKLCHPTP